MTEKLTLEDQLRSALPDLTRAERQLASHILSHYPMAALGSITLLAKASQVSRAARCKAGFSTRSWV